MYKFSSLRRVVLCLSFVASTLIGIGFISSSAASADDQVINSLGVVDSVRFVPLSANDIVFNSADNKLYASIPSTAGNIGNSIAPVDPYSGTIGSAVFIGSEPTKLAFGGDGRTLYAYLSGAFSVRRYDTATQTALGSFLVGQDSFYGMFSGSDIAVSPEDPNVVAIARQAPGVSPSQMGVAIYNNGVRLTQTGPGHIEGSDLLTFTNSGATLYGSGGYSGLKRYSVTATGTTVTAQANVANGASMKYSNGKIFTSSGQVINESSMSLLGTFPSVSSQAFVPDTGVGRVYFLTQDSSSTTWTLRAYDIETFVQIGSLSIPNISGTATSLVRWGTNGLAFRTTGGQLVLVQTSLIPTNNPIPTPSATPTITPTPTPTPYTVSVREVSIPTGDVVYSAARQKLYVTVPSTAGVPRGNSVTEIDPVNGEIGASTFIGSEPTQMAMTDDESALFVGVNGSSGFRRYEFGTNTLGPVVPLGTGGGVWTAFDMEAVPGTTNSVAISRGSSAGIVVFDGTVQRPLVGSGGAYIKFGAADTMISSSGSVTRHSVTANGVSQFGTFSAGMNGEIEVKNGLIYSSNGRVLDSGFTNFLGTFSGINYDSAVAIDIPNSRALFLANNSSSGGWSIRAYDLATFRFIGSVPLPSGVQSARKLIRWGTNGLAFRTDSNRVYIVQTNLVDGGGPVPTPSPTPTITPTPSPTPAATFVRRLNIPANDLIYNSQMNVVVASVAGIAGAPLGNTMTHIDPATGEVVASTFIGSEPKMIAASNDGQTLYTTLTGANAIRNYNLVTRVAGPQFTPTTNFQNPQDMKVVPGNAGMLALAGNYNGAAIFESGFQRPQTATGGAYSINSIAFTEDPNVFYGYGNVSSSFELVKFTIVPNGVTGTSVAGNLVSGYGAQIKYHNGLLYTTNGRVVNPEARSLIGTFQGSGSTMAIDAAANRIYYLSNNVLTAFDLQTYVKIGSVTINGFSGAPTSLARWGANGLVFRAPTSSSSNDSQIYLVQTALVSNAAPIPTGIGLSSSTNNTFESSGNIPVTVTRSGETSTTASVDYTTVDGTAVAGLDYTTRSGNLVFAAGEVSKTINVPVLNDNIYEGTENFGITLSNASGTNVFLVSPSSTTISISDDDPRPNISNVNTSVLEPNLGRNAVVNMQVQLTNPSVQTISVNFTTLNSTAVAGLDYTATNGVVTFAPLETVKSISVEIRPDLLFEPNETFMVQLSSPTNATVSTGQAFVTIRNLNHAAHMFDFDGDAKTDIGISRTSAGEWWINRSTTGQTFALQFGSSTDRIAPADYTGDGNTDIGFFRPSSGEWYILRSEDFSFFAVPFGADGDVPVPADYDADGKSDFAVFRPSTSTWYISQSSGAPTQIAQFGIAGDQPVVADYDGDGKADIGIFRPAATGGEWWIQRTTAGSLAMQFGSSTDKVVQGDYTGDGKADIAIWRPSTGEWFIVRSQDSSFYGFPFGASGDVVAPGDYDGDGKFDATVFRPSSATWYISRTTAGTQIVQFGANGDRPVANAFVP